MPVKFPGFRGLPNPTDPAQQIANRMLIAQSKEIQMDFSFIQQWITTAERNYLKRTDRINATTLNGVAADGYALAGHEHYRLRPTSSENKFPYSIGYGPNNGMKINGVTIYDGINQTTSEYDEPLYGWLDKEGNTKAYLVDVDTDIVDLYVRGHITAQDSFRFNLEVGPDTNDSTLKSFEIGFPLDSSKVFFPAFRARWEKSGPSYANGTWRPLAIFGSASNVNSVNYGLIPYINKYVETIPGSTCTYQYYNLGVHNVNVFTVSNHNSLNYLQGGAVNEYYHLNLNSYQAIASTSAWPVSTLNLVNSTVNCNVLWAVSSVNAAAESITGTSNVNVLWAVSSINTVALKATGPANVNSLWSLATINCNTLWAVANVNTGGLTALSAANVNSLWALAQANVNVLWAVSSVNTSQLKALGNSNTNTLTVVNETNFGRFVIQKTAHKPGLGNNAYTGIVGIVNPAVANGAYTCYVDTTIMADENTGGGTSRGLSFAFTRTTDGATRNAVTPVTKIYEAASANTSAFAITAVTITATNVNAGYVNIAYNVVVNSVAATTTIRHASDVKVVWYGYGNVTPSIVVV